MDASPFVASVATLIGDPTRAVMLCALKDKPALSATELAHAAGVAPNTASGHLAKLARAGLVSFQAVGRHRYYELARVEVADALEALEALGVAVAPAGRTEPPRLQSIRFARSCYDHLAGVLGVALTKALIDRGCLHPAKGELELTAVGESELSALGLDIVELKSRRRRLTKACRDWSEGRPHLGGSLGAAVFSRCCKLGWLRTGEGTRAVTLTRRGRRELGQRFGIAVPR